MDERLWTMKILAGVHAGAEVTLVEEQAVLGSDDDCDFVLEDDGLAGRHLSLLAARSGVQVTVLDASHPVRIDGQTIEGNAVLEPFQVVAVRGLAFAVGPAGQAWPTIDLPPVRAESDAPKPEAAATDLDSPEEPGEG